MMDNDELLVVIKDLFDKKTDQIMGFVDDKINKQGALIESLERNFKAVAETHSSLNTKLDNVSNEIQGLSKKVDDLDLRLEVVEKDIKSIKTDMTVVKEYVLSVDEKLNEHEVILKRVK